MICIFPILLFCVFFQGWITTSYSGYTFGEQGDVVINFVDSNGRVIPSPPTKKFPVKIYWAQNKDTSSAHALVFHEGQCDTMFFFRYSYSTAFILKDFRGWSGRPIQIRGNARQDNDSLSISMESEWEAFHIMQ